MRNKIIITVALLFMLLDFSSCQMRGVRTSSNYFQPRHTRHHWGRERHVNTRRMFWGRHRSGMRPYRNRGQIRL